MNPQSPVAAIYHPLTGLPNALLLQDRLQQAIIFGKHYSLSVAVVIIEINDFERLMQEERYARHHDDIVLIIANRLNETLYAQDSLAQIDNHKFMAILTCLIPNNHHIPALQRLTKILSEPVEINGQQLKLHFHIGISLYPSQGDTAEVLIANAEVALAYAKKIGLDNYETYQIGLNLGNIDLPVLPSELAQAIQKNEVILEYQPIYDVKTQAIIAVEALLRWQHPKYGLINPCTFIPLFEKANLIIPLSEWVLRTACMQSRSWREQGLPPIQIIINLFEQHLKTLDFTATLIKILKDARILPGQLELEISEHKLAENSQELIKLMLEMQAVGISIALNNFDIRFVNVNFVMQFPIHKIKIDRSYITNINVNTEDAKIVCAAIETAHQLKMRVIAVGVETKEQFEFLRDHQIDEIQGYYFSKPINAAGISRLLYDNISLYMRE